MTTYQLRKQAVEMEVPYHEAAFCRFRFTREQMFIESAAMDQIDSVNFDNEQGIKNYIIFTDSLDRFIDLAKESRALFLSVTRKESTDRITDEQIEQARAYPIDKLIEFTRGKALAPCHDDNAPSLSHDRKRNRATCFVCNKSFNPIDYIIMTDGLKFADAVKQLAA